MPEEAIESNSPAPANSHAKRDWLGSLVGLGIFLLGIGILFTVFSQALSLFGTPPKVEMQVQPGKPIEISSAFNGMMGVVVTVVLLILMTWVGSVIANRGIYLYSQSKMGRKS